MSMSCYIIHIYMYIVNIFMLIEIGKSQSLVSPVRRSLLMMTSSSGLIHHYVCNTKVVTFIYIHIYIYYFIHIIAISSS